MIEQITVPDIGESVESGSVVGVLVSPGALVEKDDGIIEFETEKALVEIPSPAKGKIIEILVKVGDELNIGDLIATLETDSEDMGAQPDDAIETPVKNHQKTASPKALVDTDDQDMETKPEVSMETAAINRPKSDPPKAMESITTEAPADAPETGAVEADDKEALAATDIQKKTVPAPAAPSVRRLARELGVDIHAVEGSGPGGRVSEKDVKKYLKGIATADPSPRARSDSASMTASTLPDFTRWGPVETRELSSVRRITAENMTRSWRMVPQVTQFDKADISQLEDWIETVNSKMTKSGGKLTITAILVKVIAQGLKRFPLFNASLDMQTPQMILKQYVHVGIAVDTDRGLLVPVIRDVDQKSITEIAHAIIDLADRARRKRLKPDEMEGGTFTLSNQGGIGGTQFTPIVYWPQAAILGVSRALREPFFMDNSWVPKTMLPLALSYDHRINDGADAARFLRWICDALAHPFAMHL